MQDEWQEVSTPVTPHQPGKPSLLMRGIRFWRSSCLAKIITLGVTGMTCICCTLAYSVAATDNTDVERTEAAEVILTATETVPSATATSEATKTPRPTRTPAPTSTSTPTETLTPTATYGPSPTPTATATNTATPTNTPLPTFTPLPTPTTDPRTYYESIDVRDLVINPENFRGERIRLRGQVFSIQVIDGSTELQMWVSYPGSSLFDREAVYVFYYDELTGVYEDTYIDVFGVGEGKVEGTNAFGASVTQPLVRAYIIEVP